MISFIRSRLEIWFEENSEFTEIIDVLKKKEQEKRKKKKKGKNSKKNEATLENKENDEAMVNGQHGVNGSSNGHVYLNGLGQGTASAAKLGSHAMKNDLEKMQDLMDQARAHRTTKEGKDTDVLNNINTPAYVKPGW